MRLADGLVFAIRLPAQWGGGVFFLTKEFPHFERCHVFLSSGGARTVLVIGRQPGDQPECDQPA